jgi:hypothetical protein
MTALTSIVSLLRTRQGEHEDATTYFHQLELPFETVKDVCGGPLVPMSMVSITEKVETVDDVERRTHELTINEAAKEQFNVCIFLHGLDPNRHKDWISELDTDYVANNNNYPKTLREALTQAIDREDKLRKIKMLKSRHHKPVQQPAGEPVESSFAQKAKDKDLIDKLKPILKNKLTKPIAPHQVCQWCGATGHSSDQCNLPDEYYQSDCSEQSEPEYGSCVGFGG